MLELAEGEGLSRRGRSGGGGMRTHRRPRVKVHAPYTYIPPAPGATEGLYVRDDIAFDPLPDSEHEELMEMLYEHQPESLNESLEEFQERKRDARRRRKEERHRARMDKKAAKTDIRKARAEAKRRGDPSGFDKFMKGATDITSNIMGGRKGGGDADVDTGGGGGSRKKADDSGDGEGFFSKVPTWVWWTGGGLAALGLGYVILKPKRR